MAADLQKGQDRITRANEQLNEQNQKLEERRNYIEAVLNNITAGVISLDGTGVISTVNKAAETMLGLDGREIVGLDPSELMRGEYADIFQEALSALSDGAGSVWQRQMRLNLGSREATFLVNIVSLAPTAGYGSESGLVAVFEDITELEKMQRLAAWREVARRIAHEIKNPLTPIKLSAQRLERKFGSAVEDPVFLECTMLIVQQVEQMQQMVREFSAFAKMPEVVPKPGDLAPFLQELVTLFTNSHSRISWVATIPEELPRIEFDAEAMQRVFMNIFNNAAEVLTEQAAPRVEIEALYDDILKLVRIEIRDNGPGLTAEERSRLFEPYFSRKKGGTGLGLTIARSIVTDHHGYIRVRPNQPTGTIFVIELPNLA